MTQTQKGIIFVAIGAICFSAKAIFIKLAYAQYDVDDITLLTLRFGYALPIFILIAFWRYRKGALSLHTIDKRDFGYIAILSMLGYYWASWFDFKGLQYISAGLERIILFIYPTLVVLFSRLFLKTRISKSALIALGVTYFGVMIIAAEPRIFESENFAKGGAFILVSAVTYSLYLVFGGELIKKYGSINFNSISMILSSLYVLIHFNLFSDVELKNVANGVHFYGILLAIVSTVIPTFMVMEGIKLLGANRGSIVASIGPVSTIILAYIFLGEVLSLQEIIGSTLVLAGVLMIGRK
ncbi:DMT family transporter [Arcticibacterium luteifluviistationis]|uniref:Permease n=1 Tax=Arcticibacterium luteifluviistationis TaxID=1784714 RepID=A0A2Z4GG24_9BACT|nr:DMT family transporter [Arcticibacterium luteifluviistationis]AWV99733.1 permease [Arcticibacterium luteifluviistationis]